MAGAARDEEEVPLTEELECRICQEEDCVENLDIPCACAGSLKYAHKACVQRWCNEKGDVMCEICRKQYKPSYTAPVRSSVHDETTIDIREEWTIFGTSPDFPDPRILRVAPAQNRHFLEADYDDYSASNSSGATVCRSVTLVLMALLLLRHSLSLTDEDEDIAALLSLFLLRVAGFLLPFYIMAWAIRILQQRRQREEAAVVAAREVAFILQSGHGRGTLHIAIAPDSPSMPQQEPC